MILPMLDAAHPFATADEATLRRMVAVANVPALMMTLMHLEGDDAVLSSGITPDTDMLEGREDGLSEADRDAIRARAVKAALNWRTSGRDLWIPPHAVLDHASTHIIGQDTPDSYAPLLREELPFAGPNRPAWRENEVPKDNCAEWPVVVIGAGISGIAAAVRLKRAGHPFVVLEKSDSLGGTWRDNTYPGCRVDTPNHIYSYSFAADHDWPARFSDQQTIRAYLEEVAARFDLMDHIHFGAEVVAADWNEDSAHWTVRLADGTTHTGRALISALGQLNRPKTPDLPGLDTFAGAAFHSARWDHAVDLQGKRVVVIGTGASATQFVPAIADKVAHLTVLQRSPPWLVPTPDYHDTLPEEERWLIRHWPFYAEWYRLWLFRRDGVDGVLPDLFCEEGYAGDKAVSSRNALMRDLWVNYLREQTGDDETLLAKLMPDYPPCAKRPLRDNGSWVRTLRRDDVSLIRQGIDRIEGDAVILSDGTRIPADVLIFGTGFQADRFFDGIEITGRDSASMAKAMADPCAYRGTSVPGFPNLFMLYGPNTNTVVGAGIIFFAECSARYVLGCLNHMMTEGFSSMEVTTEALETYTARMDAMNAERAWGVPGVDSWYKNAAGRVTQNWPGTHYEFWDMTLRPDPDHHVFR
jgi:4-hydroxyacetophenone monooxygenase